MFKIGDKVLYPMHGAGVIETVETKEILGDTHEYFVMRMPIGDMKVMIPIASAEGVGLRKVISAQAAQEVIRSLQEYDDDMSLNWNKRYRDNIEKIKEGDIYSVAHVVQGLMKRENDKGLSTGERKLLFSAKQILVSELVLALDADKEEIEQLVERSVSKGQNHE